MKIGPELGERMSGLRERKPGLGEQMSGLEERKPGLGKRKPFGFLAMRFIGGVKGLASGKLGLVNTPGGEGLLVSSSARTIRVLVGITSFCS